MHILFQRTLGIKPEGNIQEHDHVIFVLGYPQVQVHGCKMVFHKLIHSLNLPVPLHSRLFSTSHCLQELRKLSRVKVVDNSVLGRKAELAGKPGRIIQVYNKPGVGYIGDKVLLAIMGEKKKAYIVGCVQKQKPNVPRYDTNNVVLVEDSGAPTGTRIRVPVPSCLRGKEGDFTKILSIATKFV